MASLQILYHPEVVRRDIPSLDPPVRRRIKAAIEQRLTTHPDDFAKPLAFNKAGLESWQLIRLPSSGVPNNDYRRRAESAGGYVH